MARKNGKIKSFGNIRIGLVVIFSIGLVRNFLLKIPYDKYVIYSPFILFLN